MRKFNPDKFSKITAIVGICVLLCLSVAILGNAKNNPAKARKTTFASSDDFQTAVFLENRNMVSDYKGSKVFYYATWQYQCLHDRKGGILHKLLQRDKEAIEEAILKSSGKREKGAPEKESRIPWYRSWRICNGSMQTRILKSYPIRRGERSYKHIQKDGYVTSTVTTEGYATITYKDLYPGIDVVYSFPDKGGMKYNLIVHPGADLNAVQMQYSGAIESMTKDVDGNIKIHSETGDIIEYAPVSFYSDNKGVSSSYILNGQSIQFQIPAGYDNGKTLIVDPWVQILSNMPPVNMGFDVDYDWAGNTIVYGAGSTDPNDLTDYFNVSKI